MCCQGPSGPAIRCARNRRSARRPSACRRSGAAARAGHRRQPRRPGAQRNGAQGHGPAAASEQPQIVHQAGEKHLEALKANYAAAGVQRRIACLHRRHGRRLRMGRSGDLPRRRADRRRTGGCRRCQHPGARSRSPSTTTRPATPNSWSHAGGASPAAAGELTPESRCADPQLQPRPAAANGRKGTRTGQARCHRRSRRACARRFAK
jgi:hypothetical protein